MDNKIIIQGEASETDSEDEARRENEITPSAMTRSIQGAIIAGEASESEDEHGSSVSSAVSALTHHPSVKSSVMNQISEENNDEKFSSLLHKKLKERNRSLHTSLRTHTHNIINETTRDLTSINQHLLKSQVTLQAAITSLRTLNFAASTLKDKQDFVISSQFFPNVRMASPQ